MAFLLGLAIGIVVGLGLIVGFVRCENTRSKLRSELAATIAAFARMTVEDSRKLLPPQYYPSWVVFSQRQKVSLLSLLLKIVLDFYWRVCFEWQPIFFFFLGFNYCFQLTWLNQHLIKIWPYVNEVTFMVFFNIQL